MDLSPGPVAPLARALNVFAVTQLRGGFAGTSGSRELKDT